MSLPRLSVEELQNARERIVLVKIDIDDSCDFFFENDTFPYVYREFVENSPTYKLMYKIEELIRDYNSLVDSNNIRLEG